MPILAKHKAALQALRKRFTGADWPKAARMMSAGRFDGDIGAELHDFLADTVMNNGTGIWSGLIDQGHDKYPVTVCEYCGLFWVHALEYDPVGYFRSRQAAVSYVTSEWDAVQEHGTNESSDFGRSIPGYRPLSAQEEHDLENEELELQREALGIRVIVCGGRDFADREAVYNALDALHSERKITMLVHGGARGADALAADWAASRSIATEVFAADWKRHGRGAGPKRNQQMADAGADVCLAFPGGTGTADMMRRAAAAGIEVVRHDMKG